MQAVLGLPGTEVFSVSGLGRKHGWSMSDKSYHFPTSAAASLVSLRNGKHGLQLPPKPDCLELQGVDFCDYQGYCTKDCVDQSLLFWRWRNVPEAYEGIFYAYNDLLDMLLFGQWSSLSGKEAGKGQLQPFSATVHQLMVWLFDGCTQIVQERKPLLGSEELFLWFLH